MKSNEEKFVLKYEIINDGKLTNVQLDGITQAINQIISPYKQDNKRLSEAVERLKQKINLIEPALLHLNNIRTHLNLKEGESIIDRVKELQQNLILDTNQNELWDEMQNIILYNDQSIGTKIAFLKTKFKLKRK